jgi:hypothetical protein
VQKLNGELSKAVAAAEAGTHVVDTMRARAFPPSHCLGALYRNPIRVAVHGVERHVRAAEAVAATKKIAIAQRNAMVEQLEYLVSVQRAISASLDANVTKQASLVRVMFKLPPFLFMCYCRLVN